MQIMRTRRVQEKKQATSPKKGGLLAARVWNAFPYSGTIMDAYTTTKQSNQMLKAGLNLAESCAMAVSSPFLSKYEAIDKFAASQLEKIESRLGVDLVSKSVGVMAYPIGYSLGLAGFARNKAGEVVSPVFEYTYEVADVVIDQLLPAQHKEAQENSRREKSPFRRIRERATINSVMRLPSTAFFLSMHLFTSSLYLFMGLASISMSRMLSAAIAIVNSINVQFEADLTRPWTVLSNGDLTRLYRAIVFHGFQSVNAAIDEIEEQALELSQYLDNRNLPYNARVVRFVAGRLKMVERRLVQLAGVQLVATSATVSSPVTPPRRTVKAQVTPRSTPRKRDLTETRPATMMLGDDQPAWHERAEHEEGEHEEHLHHLSPHKIEVLEDRAPTMMWGSQKRKSHPQISQEVSEPRTKEVKTPTSTEIIVAPSKEVIVLQPKETVLTLPTTSANKSSPVSTSKPKLSTVSRPLRICQETKQKESLETAEISKEETKEVSQKKKAIAVPKPKIVSKPAVWPKVSSKEFVKRAEANRRREEEKRQQEALRKEEEERKERELRREEEIRRELEEKANANVDEHGFAPVKASSHHHVLPQDVAKAMAKEMLPPRKHVPATPVNSPAGELLTNNPYGDILVQDDEVVKGPVDVDTQVVEAREQELIAHQTALQKKALHELLSTVASRLERVEQRAEENAQSGPWQVAKHTVHVEVEEPTPEPNPETIPAPENNPFAKLPTETTEDPFSMGLSAM